MIPGLDARLAPGFLLAISHVLVELLGIAIRLDPLQRSASCDQDGERKGGEETHSPIRSV